MNWFFNAMLKALPQHVHALFRQMYAYDHIEYAPIKHTNHKRSYRERTIRRQRHATRMRNTH